jgi:spore maturation protein CgeB
MKILLVCPKYEYGDEKRDFSYEYKNFFLTLQNSKYEIDIFDFFFEFKTHGKEKMNFNFLKIINNNNYGMIIFSMHRDEFFVETLIEAKKITTTLCLFYDDTWRKEYTSFWSKYFTFFTTTDIYGGLAKINNRINNRIYFPYGCNNTIYKKIDNIKKIYDVSFVGSWHPHREWIVKKIKKYGINVEVFGYGWPNGPLKHDDMVKVFNQTKINLNLSNTISWDIRYLFSSYRSIINSFRSEKNREQLKARLFEINGCGAFQISHYIDGIETFYDIRKEIEVFTTLDDLLDKIKFYLNNEELLNEIASNGYQKTIYKHSYLKRFEDMINKIVLFK